MYPPQFLLLPNAVLCVSDDFLVQRALWYGMMGGFLALCFWIVALWAGEKGKWHTLLLIPVLWSSLITLITLQIGNVHHVVMAMAVLSMVAFQVKKPVWGGALLAFAILSKISPGILVIILLVQRRWRDLAWTMAFGMIYTLLTVLVFGLDPVLSFLHYQLPRIASGDTMRWFADLELNILVNSSPFGIPFKLSLLGVPFEDVWASARLVNTLFTLCIVGLSAWAARKNKDRMQLLSMWLGVLTLSSLQSPFAPGYVVMPVIWLLTVLAAEVRSSKALVVFAIVFFLIAFPIPITGAAGAVYSLFQQVLVLGVIVFGLFYRTRAGGLA